MGREACFGVFWWVWDEPCRASVARRILWRISGSGECYAHKHGVSSVQSGIEHREATQIWICGSVVDGHGGYGRGR